MKTIPNFPSYSITEDGKVYSFTKKSRGKELERSVCKSSGFYYVDLYNSDGKTRLYIHKLVAECYIPNPHNYTIVKHNNGDKLDNRKDNLEWRECYRSLPEYGVWSGMLTRCNPKYKEQKIYLRYSGRGISVCERWKVFENFYQDMGKRPGDNYELDRINNDGNYCPDNCRWVTRQDNVNNKANLRKIVIDGEEKTLREIAIEYGINFKTVAKRYDKGLRGKDIIKPVRKLTKRRQN